MKALLIMTLLFTTIQAWAYEEPKYDVVESTDEYEIRWYPGYVVAETVVNDRFRKAGNSAFRILFGYISGKNHRTQNMDVQTNIQRTKKEKIEMTIPVINSMPDPENGGEYVYRFVMPDRMTLEQLPTPDDPRITLRQIEGHLVAVRRFKGCHSEKRFHKQRKLLEDQLNSDGRIMMGTTTFARYNGPMTPCFLRRNEVMVPLRQEG